MEEGATFESQSQAVRPLLGLIIGIGLLIPIVVVLWNVQMIGWHRMNAPGQQ